MVEDRLPAVFVRSAGLSHDPRSSGAPVVPFMIRRWSEFKRRRRPATDMPVPDEVLDPDAPGIVIRHGNLIVSHEELRHLARVPFVLLKLRVFSGWDLDPVMEQTTDVLSVSSR
jgi:hypothetical protein